MKRVIKATATNGDIDMTISINVKLTGYLRETETSKINAIKDDLYAFLSEKYHYSQIKIK